MNEITYARVPFRNLVCPECKEMGSMRRRLMGMPGADFNHARYESGGCMVDPGFDHDLICTKCDWEGFRIQLDASMVPNEFLLEDVFGVSQEEFYNASGDLLYFWDVGDTGVNFEFESNGAYGTPFSMDMEIQFIIPESEYPKVKELFGIDADVDISDAIEEISGSALADDFCDSLNSDIKVVSRSVWISSD
jgi:hypothetical protein